MNLKLNKSKAIRVFAMTFAIVFAAAGITAAVASIGAPQFGLFALTLIILSGSLMNVAISYRGKDDEERIVELKIRDMKAEILNGYNEVEDILNAIDERQDGVDIKLSEIEMSTNNLTQICKNTVAVFVPPKEDTTIQTEERQESDKPNIMTNADQGDFKAVPEENIGGVLIDELPLAEKVPEKKKSGKPKGKKAKK